MDAFHERLARVGLEVLAPYGFCLAGGYAVQAHGLLDRPSEDIDLFTTIEAEAQFPAAVIAAVAAYSADGLDVTTPTSTATFARLSVTDPVSGATSKVELDDLLRLAEEHDPGFDAATFADALRAVPRLPSAEFQAYGLSTEDTSALIDRPTRWATSIHVRHA